MTRSASAWRRSRSALSRAAGVSTAAPASISMRNGTAFELRRSGLQTLAQRRRAQVLALDAKLPDRGVAVVGDAEALGLHRQLAHHRGDRAGIDQAQHQPGPAVGRGAALDARHDA